MTYDHFLGRNPYSSKRPKRLRRTFPPAFLSSALVGVLSALVERIGMNKTAQQWTSSRLRDGGMGGDRRATGAVNALDCDNGRGIAGATMTRTMGGPDNKDFEVVDRFTRAEMQ